MLTSIFDCCNGDNSLPLQQFNFFMDLSSSLSDDTSAQVSINGQFYDKHIALEEVEIIVRILRKNWSYLQRSVLEETAVSCDTIKKCRQEINKCLKLIVNSLKACDVEPFKKRYLVSVSAQIRTFLPLVLPVSELGKNIYVPVTSSTTKEKCPIYQYFHTLQEVRYYLLLLDYISRNSDQFQSHTEQIMRDLISMNRTTYKKDNKSVFVCSCSKNFWLILQALLEKVLGEDSFWPIFNRVVENEDPGYILHLLQDVATLQTFDANGKYIGCLNENIKTNFPLLESSLKNYLNNNNASVLSALKSLEPLLCNTWLKFGRIEVYQILWEFFSKRLNKTNRTNVNFTMPQIVELLDTILWTPKDCDEDFELFVSMLCSHLNDHPHHWGKMRGRIYSQLGPNKLKDLNDVGTFNVMLLFLSLTKVNFEELSKKFTGFVEGLPPEKKQQPMIWSFYTTFIIRNIRENRSIETGAPLLIKLLEEASTDHKLFPLIKNFVSDFDNILRFSNNLQLHQWLLLNSWLHKYMSTCYHSDLVTLLTVLVTALERIVNEEAWSDWETSFKSYVYPTLKYVAASTSAPEICGTLGAKIALLSPSLLPEAFSFFNADIIIPKVASNFLCIVLENHPNSFLPTTQQETLAVQSWVKVCLLTRDNYQELTRNIVKLDIIPAFIKTEIASAKDPLIAFIEYVGSNVKQHAQSTNISKLCDIFFGQAERWIGQYFHQPENEAVVLRIYTCIGLAFYKIGPLLYNKHKSNCPYERLVTAMLLPTELLIGKPLNPLILQSIKKTWHLFFEASAKLNSSNDAYIDRILREMVVKYVPHFSTADSPMLKSLDNETVADVILEKISNAFFKQPSKEAESNVFKALRIVNDFVQSTTSAVLVKLVVSKTLYGLCEMVMFHSQRNMALSVIKNVTLSPTFLQVRPDVDDVVLAITEKHLAFNAPNYFQLMEALAKLVTLDLKRLMPRVKQQISNIERMRGVGFDKNLRLSLGRLEAALLQMS